MDNPNDLWPTEPAGEYLRKPSATLQWWRTVGRGPKYVKIGRSVFYRKRDLDDFITACERAPEREVA